MAMVIMLMFRWWYSDGWRWAWQRSVNKRLADYNRVFSLSQLIKTWFSPFKQTYSKGRRGSIDAIIQAAIDNFVSRIIGAIARTFIIIAGLIAITFALISGVAIFLLWPFLPIMPVLAIMLALSGVTL